MIITGLVVAVVEDIYTIDESTIQMHVVQLFM